MKLSSNILFLITKTTFSECTHVMKFLKLHTIFCNKIVLNIFLNWYCIFVCRKLWRVGCRSKRSTRSSWNWFDRKTRSTRQIWRTRLVNRLHKELIGDALKHRLRSFPINVSTSVVDYEKKIRRISTEQSTYIYRGETEKQSKNKNTSKLQFKNTTKHYIEIKDCTSLISPKTRGNLRSQKG